MKRTGILIINLVLFTIIIIINKSCYYNSEEALFPDSNIECDSADVTFASTIRPILQENCLSCHSNLASAALGDNIRLENYSDVKLRVDDGSLFGAVSHQPAFSPMPKDGRKMDNCKISYIKEWIDSGALNN